MTEGQYESGDKREREREKGAMGGWAKLKGWEQRRE